MEKLKNKVQFYVDKKNGRVYLRSDSLVRRRIKDLRNYAQTIINECDSFDNR